jgi:hypothetical protein
MSTNGPAGDFDVAMASAWSGPSRARSGVAE